MVLKRVKIQNLSEIWGFIIRADANLNSNTIISVFWYFLNYTKNLMFYKMRAVGLEITFLWNKALIFIIIIHLFFLTIKFEGRQCFPQLY